MRWRGGNRRRKYRIRLARRILGLVFVLGFGTLLLSHLAETRAPKPARGVRWGEVPPSAAPRRAEPELPYRIQANLPWLRGSAAVSSRPVPRPVVLSELPTSPTLMAAAPVFPLEKEPVLPVRPEPVVSAAHPKLVEGKRPAQDRPVEARTEAASVPPPAMDSTQQWIESLLPAILESTLPVLVQVSLERLDRFMEVVGETELARRFTEKEFQRVVSATVQQRSRGQISDLKTEIHGDGFWGEGMVNLGNLKLIVSLKVGVRVAEDRPHVLLRRMRVGSFEVSQPTLRLLEAQVNRFLASQRYPLLIQEFRANEGWAWVSVKKA